MPRQCLGLAPQHTKPRRATSATRDRNNTATLDSATEEGQCLTMPMQADTHFESGLPRLGHILRSGKSGLCIQQAMSIT